MILAFAMLLTSCGLTGRATDGRGYVLNAPSQEMVDLMIAHDRGFAKRVLRNDTQCLKDKGCEKE